VARYLGELANGERWVLTLGRTRESTVAFGRPDIASDGSGYVRIPMVLRAEGVVAETAIEVGADPLSATRRSFEGSRVLRLDPSRGVEPTIHR